MSSKRISYFNDDTKEENPENIKIDECFDLNDIINNDKTYEILKNDHYFTYLTKMENNIIEAYSYWKNTNKCSHFLDNDEYDLDGSDFVELIYKHIYKNYSAQLFYDNIEFTKPLLEEETIKPVIKKEKIIINNNVAKKKFDWNTKSYK